MRKKPLALVALLAVGLGGSSLTMPLDAARVGVVPPQSPLTTNAILAWTMNFCAAVDDFSPLYVDNTAGSRPAAHPLFLAGATEIIGAWACLYASGITKAEVTRNTFAHHSFDAVMERPLLSGEKIKTEARLVGVGVRRSGGHFVSRFRHADEAGAVVSTSWWGGILVGYQGDQGSPAATDHYLPEEQAPSPPEIAVLSSPTFEIITQTLLVSAAQAHLWDACIRDPRNAKAASSDINVHTNMSFAEKAGLKGRTLNGLCLLGIAMTCVLKMTSVAESWEGLKRVGGIFGAPVLMLFDPVSLEVSITGRGPNAEGDEVILFSVATTEGKSAIRSGYILVSATAASSWWGSSRM